MLFMLLHYYACLISNHGEVINWLLIYITTIIIGHYYPTILCVLFRYLIGQKWANQTKLSRILMLLVFVCFCNKVESFTLIIIIIVISVCTWVRVACLIFLTHVHDRHYYNYVLTMYIVWPIVWYYWLVCCTSSCPNTMTEITRNVTIN